MNVHTLKPSTTTLSTKGQLILPKAVRDSRRWPAGTRLIVEETAEGVLLKRAPLFPSSRPEDVFGSLDYTGPAVTVEDINEAVLAEASSRYERSRY